MLSLNKWIALSLIVAGISLSSWIYGNSIEQQDMSNAGLQVFGFLGTAFSSIAFIALLIVKILLFIKRSQR